MDHCGSTSTIITSFAFMFIILFLCPQLLSVLGDEGVHQGQGAQNLQEKLIKTVTDTISTLKKSHQRSWDKIKTIIHDMQLQFFPPNLDFRGEDEGNDKNEVGGVTTQRMKIAAEKSFSTSKMAAEKSAESAASAVGAVGEAIHETTEKVKKRPSDDDEKPQHDEL